MNVIKTHTPLHLAARNGHMNVVSYFLSCGMDVNIKVTIKVKTSISDVTASYSIALKMYCVPFSAALSSHAECGKVEN